VYGTPAGNCQGTVVPATVHTTIQVNGGTRHQWQVELDGLTPDTAYCYRVVQGEKDLLGSDPSPVFRTPPGPDTTDPFSFAVIGDWGAGTAAERSVLARIGESDADFITTVGDNAYVFGSQTDWGDSFTDGKGFGPSYFWKQGATRPIFPAHGNHGFEDFTPHIVNFPQNDVVDASGGRYEADEYCCLASEPDPTTRASLWYAFDWGAARLYMLQTAWSDLSADQYQTDFEAHWNGPVAGCDACGAQRAWLEDDLAAHADTEIKLAFFHYPLHSEGLHGGDPYLTGAGSLEELLADNGVDIVFNGHDHIYQRNLPAVAGSDMVSYVTGGGGQFLYQLSTPCETTTAYALGGGGTACGGPARTPNTKVFHFLHVVVDENVVTITPTDSTGETFDVQTYTFD
jgi:hypothetical protein